MSDNEKVQKLRFEFEKAGKTRFISHLDLLRLMQRVMGRARVPLWHSEGFNPHPYIAFGQPLSLGHEGLREIMDVHLTERVGDTDALCAAINAAAPEGLRMRCAFEPVRPLREIALAECEIVLYDLPAERIPELRARIAGPSCVVQKKSGKDEFVPLDILPFLHGVEISEDPEGVRVRAVVDCAPSRVLNPQYLADGLMGGAPYEALHRRLRLMDADGNDFR